MTASTHKWILGSACLVAGVSLAIATGRLAVKEPLAISEQLGEIKALQMNQCAAGLKSYGFTVTQSSSAIQAKLPASGSLNNDALRLDIAVALCKDLTYSELCLGPGCQPAGSHSIKFVHRG